MAEHENRRVVALPPVPDESPDPALARVEATKNQHGRLVAKDKLFEAAYARRAFYEAVVEGHHPEELKAWGSVRGYLVFLGTAGDDNHPSYVPEAEFNEACRMSLADAKAAVEAAEAAIDARGRSLLGGAYLSFRDRFLPLETPGGSRSGDSARNRSSGDPIADDQPKRLALHAMVARETADSLARLAAEENTSQGQLIDEAVKLLACDREAKRPRRR